MTCSPRATSAEQNSSGQPSICVARPITSSTGGASRSPKRSYAMSMPDGLAPRMTSGLIDRASPRFRPRPDPKENLETAAQPGHRRAADLERFRKPGPGRTRPNPAIAMSPYVKLDFRHERRERTASEAVPSPRYLRL